MGLVALTLVLGVNTWMNCVCAEAGAAKEAATQKTALRLGEHDDLPAIATADRMEIQRDVAAPKGLRKSIGIAAREDLNKIQDMLKVAETAPSGGEIAYSILFIKDDKLVRQVWVYLNGEWGVVRAGSPSWTLGLNKDLPQALEEFLKQVAPSKDAKEK